MNSTGLIDETDAVGVSHGPGRSPHVALTTKDPTVAMLIKRLVRKVLDCCKTSNAKALIPRTNEKTSKHHCLRLT